MKSRKLLSSLAIFGISLAIPGVSFAGAIISEIMYDLPGTDSGREWIEVRNTGTEEVSFLKWKLFEANTNHGLTLFQGDATTSASGFAIIADDPAKFLTDNPQYQGTLFDSSFSLSNAGEALELKVDDASVYQTTYVSSSGGAGDGSSLHASNNAFVVGVPSPGSAAIQAPISPAPVASSSPETEEAPPPGTPAPASESATYGATTEVYKPQIFVNALVPQRGVTGVPVVFDAVATGLKKEPLQNARYVWSFGDGGTAEGKKVYHVYHYPAAYTVLVDASSGEWSATDRKEITVATPELVISNIKTGEDGFIEVQNNGKGDVDLSLWLLKSGTRTFTIPQGTLIGARKAIPFPAPITNLLADPKSTALLYPNEDLVVAYEKKNIALQPLPAGAGNPVAAPVAGPLKKETPKNREDATLGPAPKKQSESARQATSTVASRELIGAAIVAEGQNMTPWLLGVGLLLLVSVGAYLLLLRPKPEPSAAEELQKEAAKFDIIE